MVLTSKPAGDVTVTISGHSGTDLTVASAGLNEDGALTFTADNWATVQTVTVKASEDDDGVTDADVSLAHAVSSDDDTGYNALADQTRDGEHHRGRRRGRDHQPDHPDRNRGGRHRCLNQSQGEKRRQSG